LIGTLLKNRYRVDAKLGEGGMGVVYKAHDSLLQRTVAIKTLSPVLLGEEGLRRFLREAQSSAQLNHPHIVSIFDVVEEAGSFALVMELVEGKTLRDLLPISIGRLVEISTQVLQGLDYAHSQGIVHRDIKPENIIVAPDGVVKLMDFGLARSEGRTRLTRTGLIVGTVAYLAPEQALGGQVDGRSDLYSLGAVLYEAVTGHPPFESEDPISVITQHINIPPVAPHWHNPAVPPTLENVILKLLAKDPARRFQTAREVLTALASTGSQAPAVLPTEPEKVTGPTLVESIAHSPLVGRDRELSSLKDLIDRASTGRGGVVLLRGPLGVGKTRLVEEAATFARMRGVAVVSGKAYESAPPYEPFVKSLRDLARGTDSETLAASLGEFAGELTALIPELDRQLPKLPGRLPAPPEEQKNRLFSGVTRFLDRTATRAPILLFLDDMHLADGGSIELLQHIARRTEASRVLLIVGYRPEEIPSTATGRLFSQVTHALSREGFCTVFSLRPLGEDEVIALIQRMASHATRPVHFGRRIFEVTEGNPYFIEEVLKGLFEQGTLYIKDGQWSTDFDNVKDYSLMEVPTSVHGAVETRVRTLTDATRQILTYAAVVGRQFDFDTLLALAGSDEAALLDRVEEAIHAQLIREVRGAGEDVYEFTQPMLRQVLYDSIPRRRRRLLHRQVGETLDKLYGREPDAHLEALAWHSIEAEDPEKTLKYAHLAARKAASVFAYDDAARYLNQAITAAEELERSTERLQLMEELAELYLTAGKRDQDVIRLLEDAVNYWKNLPSASIFDGARLYRKLGEAGSRWAVFNPRTREHIMEGLRLLENAPQHPERVKLIIAKASDLYWLRPAIDSDYSGAEASALEGYRLAESIGSLKDMSAALDALAGLYEVTADFPKMLATTERRSPIVEQINDWLERVDLHHMLARAYEWLGNYGEALAHAERFQKIASQAGSGFQFFAISVAARICVWWDRWDAAEPWFQLYDETKVQAGIGPYFRGQNYILASRVLAEAARGNLDDARRHESELQSLPRGHPGQAWAATGDLLRVAMALGNVDNARDLVDQCLRLADTPWAKLRIHTLVLDFASQTGGWDLIEKLGGESLERARRSHGRHYVALNCYTLGIHRREHGQLDEANALLTEAVDVFRAIDCRWQLARALRELGLLRRAQRNSDYATKLLQEAMAHFEALGALPDLQRTRALM